MSSERCPTILLVEDQALISMSYKRDLEKLGYKVLTVFTGEEAVEIVDKTPDIDLILMDIHLGSGIDGTEASKIILEKRELPLIFVTSHTDPATIEKVEQIPSYGFLTRSSGQMQIRVTIGLALRLHREKIGSDFDAPHHTQYESALEQINRELQLSEEALRESEHRNRALLDALPDMMFLFNEEGYFIDYHATKSSKLLLPPESFLGKHLTEVLPPELARLTLDHLAKVIDKRELQSYEYQLEMGGETMHFESRLVYCGDNCALSVVRDITERVMYEQELRAYEKQMHSLVEGSRAMLFSTDLKGRFTFVNRTAEDFLNVPVKQVLGRFYLQFVHPDDRKRVHDLYQDQIRNVTESTYQEFRYRGVDNKGGWVSFLVNPLIEDGQIAGLTGVAQDITERKHAEEALERSLEEKKVLLSELHHRVKNNMAVISSLMTLQSEFGDDIANTPKKDPDTLLKDIQARILAIGWVHELVYESSNYSEIDSEKLFSRLAKYLEENYKPEGKEITIAVRSGKIYLDMNNSVPLTLFVNELISNAYRHAFEGRQKGHIEVVLERDDEGIHFVIADDGIGVDDLDKISRPDSFGYTIVHGLVNQLRGKITFVAPPKGGLRVEAWFPAKHKDHPPA